jgi:MFS superfamily sulfate permease-like transporter
MSQVTSSHTSSHTPFRGGGGVFSSVHWPSLFKQIPKVIRITSQSKHTEPCFNTIHLAVLVIVQVFGLFIVVCFGSCMDIAAIQQDAPKAISYDSELFTIGLSNVVTSIFGSGLTGSYIFSLTLFTLR